MRGLGGALRVMGARSLWLHGNVVGAAGAAAVGAALEEEAAVTAVTRRDLFGVHAPSNSHLLSAWLTSRTGASYQMRSEPRSKSPDA